MIHTLTKVKYYRWLLYCTYPVALVVVYPLFLLKKKNATGYFFFFDRYVIGGAQTVYLNLLNAIPEIYKELYFTRQSLDDKLKKDFYSLQNTKCKDIHFWCDNLLLRLFTVHYYSFHINRHKQAVIYGSNSTFFHDMLPFINKRNIKIELLHSFAFADNGLEYFGIANYKYLNFRNVVDRNTQNHIKDLYAKYNIPEHYNKRVVRIEPGVTVPQNCSKDYTLPLKVLYAGRGTAEKRVNLIDKIATHILKNGFNIEFHFAGTMEDQLSAYVKQHATMYGEVTTQEQMYELYKNCHIVILTSYYEGFPMSIKEGMANGCVPVSTMVGGITSHLVHNENALLIDQPRDEAHVVAKGLEHLTHLATNAEELIRLSQNCYQYAQKHFDKGVFMDKYHEFLSKSIFQRDC